MGTCEVRLPNNRQVSGIADNPGNPGVSSGLYTGGGAQSVCHLPDAELKIVVAATGGPSSPDNAVTLSNIQLRPMSVTILKRLVSFLAIVAF